MMRLGRRALALIVPSWPLAQARFNFPDRKAIVLDTGPHLKITGFTFENTFVTPRSPVAARSSLKHH